MAGPRDPQKALTYSRYLKLDELLALQQPLSAAAKQVEHDEMLFIVIHQVYELWFKQINHEIRELQRRLEANDEAASLAGFKRILTILKILVAQVDILETMSPVSFGSFRARLESASGFQSAQFREMEFLLGAKRAKAIDHHPADGAGKRLRQLLVEPSLYDSFLRFLDSRGYSLPKDVLTRSFDQRPVASPAVQKVLIEIYRTDHIAEAVCERMVDLDEGLQEWRYRHVKMVERTIGRKSGTGGSAGAAYLKSTLFEPLFPDLWAIRDEL